MTITISGTSGVTYPAGGTDNVAGAGVGTTDTQTLTNKTLTSPTLNTATINSFTSPNLTEQSTVGFKNRIINGAMVIDQRNAGASITPTTSTYTVDRWEYQTSVASKITAQQNAGSVTPPAGFKKYLGFTTAVAASPAAGDVYEFCQKIEGFNCFDFNWGTASAATITLSFWVRSSLTGTHSGSVTNNSGNRSYPFTFTVSSANTWEQKAVTIAGDTSGTWMAADSNAGMILYFNLGSGTTYTSTANSWQAGNYVGVTGAVQVVGTLNATFYITGVQLEKGSTATSFDYRPYGTELALCQRYYEKSYDQTVVPGTATSSGFSFGMLNTSATSSFYAGNVDKFAVVKRTAATMRFWDVAGNLSRISNYTGGGLVRTDNNNSVYSYTGYQQNAVMINAQAALTLGAYGWDASAEL